MNKENSNAMSKKFIIQHLLVVSLVAKYSNTTGNNGVPLLMNTNKEDILNWEYIWSLM